MNVDTNAKQTKNKVISKVHTLFSPTSSIKEETNEPRVCVESWLFAPALEFVFSESRPDPHTNLVSSYIKNEQDIREKEQVKKV